MKKKKEGVVGERKARGGEENQMENFRGIIIFKGKTNYKLSAYCKGKEKISKI